MCYIKCYFLIVILLKHLTPEPWPDGELVFEQSSELDEDVDVGVMETELFPEIRILKNIYQFFYKKAFKSCCKK